MKLGGEVDLDLDLSQFKSPRPPWRYFSNRKPFCPKAGTHFGKSKTRKKSFEPPQKYEACCSARPDFQVTISRLSHSSPPRTFVHPNSRSLTKITKSKKILGGDWGGGHLETLILEAQRKITLSNCLRVVVVWGDPETPRLREA